MKYQIGDKVWVKHWPNAVFIVKNNIGMTEKQIPLYIMKDKNTVFECIADETEMYKFTELE